MLMGCSELFKIGSVNTIIECDAYSAIQWGSCRVKCPWHLVDWVDEIILILRQLQCMFHHVLLGGK